MDNEKPSTVPPLNMTWGFVAGAIQFALDFGVDEKGRSEFKKAVSDMGKVADLSAEYFKEAQEAIGWLGSIIENDCGRAETVEILRVMRDRLIKLQSKVKEGG
jgi:hypothetical protein